jgi:metal-responsive CopG/Arc/MetJ family transcriptional regulator
MTTHITVSLDDWVAEQLDEPLEHGDSRSERVQRALVEYYGMTEPPEADE